MQRHRNFSVTVISTGGYSGGHIEYGAGYVAGASYGITALGDGSVTQSVGLAAPPYIPALKVGAYGGAGTAYGYQAASRMFGC